MGSSLIERLARDRRSSSAAIVKATSIELARIAEHRPQRELLRGCEILIESHPSMAALIRLCMGIIRRLETSASIDDLIYFSTGFEQLFSRHLEQAAHHGARIIPEGGKVMTYSSSGSVGTTLANAHDAGKNFEVLISEGRPASEGVEMAKRLVEAGIPTTLMTDLALANRVAESSIVIVGCDAITSKGVINKTGTSALALLAKMAGVPLVCLATSEKLLDAEDEESFRIIPHPAREIAANLPTALTVDNRYFDATPITLFHAIILEDGPMPKVNPDRCS